ncbi:uncharacterized protein FOMMEDRAFT_129141 [Fomitiporia mediterranea MF3/22]|uniref:uncharacterized protein n=1 Tax=Fomitiporia mediterranea (strain MF3/22) TaxID=694068 RepID=UPI0004408392|nr:uncharacterized protein FOMMEDRAFT_129141 [Fomitiporia mediterranea MF3/22]EJC98789.1 hypothetical protein FOMMEDRAFT_129141 [Fomitiporia mediterranea MF3/22]
MAILGFFKKDKAKTSSSQASTTSSIAAAVDDNASSEDYVLSPPSVLLPSVGNGDDGYTSSSASFISAASSKKLRLPFIKKPSAASSSPLLPSLAPARSPLNASSDKLSLRLDTSFNGSSLHAPVFPAHHVSSSTPTLPRAEANTRPQPMPLQKSGSPNAPKSSGGLFGWRERRKSKPAKPDPETLALSPLTDESFNLKSFRHVLPETRSNSPSNRTPAQSPSPQSFVPPVRPRGASVASTDSSQRISVAAFREAQARRSSTNLVSGSPSPTIRPVSLANSTISDIPPPPKLPLSVQSSGSASPGPGRERKSNPSRQSKVASSDTTSSEESDSDEYSPSRSRSRLSRQRTITRRSYGASSDLGHGSSRVANNSHHQQTSSARSELGHGSSAHASHTSPSPSRGPPPSSFQKSAEAFMGTRSFSLYRRQRASYSTSELNPSAAAQRATTLAEAKKRELAAQRRAGGDSDTSESSSDSDSSDEDAPLAVLKQPKRPGSAFSHRSSGTSTPSRKPLIDLNAKSNPLSGKPIADSHDPDQEKPRTTLISPTNINNRLTQLTAGLTDHHNKPGSKSEANLSRVTTPRPSYVDPSKPDSPASTSTITPPIRTQSPKPLPTHSKRASVPVLPVSNDFSKSRAEDSRPVPIKDRPDRNTGFRVVSRPQKSATTPPSFAISMAGPSNHLSKESGPVSHHRHSSSSTLIAVSRPPTDISSIATRPLLAASQNGSAVSASGSSISGTSSSQRTGSDVQKLSQKPFTFAGKRQESPASSTGGSSNGKAPLTPMDGSDYFNPEIRGSGDSPAGSSIGATPPSAMKGARGHLKRASVSFQEPVEFDKDETVRGRKSSMSQTKSEKQHPVEERENRLRERRRSEAKAAIDFGNVVNGRGPLNLDEDNEDTMISPQLPPLNFGNNAGVNLNMQMGWQQQGMSSPMMGGMGPMGTMPGMPGMNMGMGLNPSQFMVPTPPPGADTAFLAAHQHAMRIAKQAYQYAVAQQAMAAAADEWERGSSVSAFTAPGAGMGTGMGGYGMAGMSNMWGGGTPMFPAAPQSMYAGSNGMGAMSEAGWGTASVYGESFGPSVAANARRSQVFNNRNSSSGGPASMVGFPTYQRAESTSNMPQSKAQPSRGVARPRTKTAPSNMPTPAQYRQSRGPPSSWRAGT